MSARTKENFYIEFKVCSDIQGDLFAIKISEQELNIKENYGNRNFGYITRRSRPLSILKKKFPVYLKDAIAQTFQEIEIESNPFRLKFLIDERAEALINQISHEQIVKGKRVKKEKNLSSEDKERIIRSFKKLSSEKELNFYTQIMKKASISLLDFVIILNENNLDDLVYLFDDQTLLRNSVFFDLFQHWFVSPGQAAKINEFIRALKQKANIRPGPPSFTDEKKLEILFRYEYLRRIFKKIKENIKKQEQISADENIEKRWNKLKSFLGRNKYFKVDNEVAKEREIRKGYSALEYLGYGWFKNNFNDFKYLYLFEMSEAKAKKRIKEHINEIIEERRKETIQAHEDIINRNARLTYLKSISNKLERKRYFDLERDIEFENYGLRYLYKKYNLKSIDTYENIGFKINKFKMKKINKTTHDISEEHYERFKVLFARSEILKVIEKHKPSKLSIFLLSKIYDVSQRKIERIIENNKEFLDKSSIILSRYPHLKIS